MAYIGAVFSKDVEGIQLSEIDYLFFIHGPVKAKLIVDKQDMYVVGGCSRLILNYILVALDKF